MHKSGRSDLQKCLARGALCILTTLCSNAQNDDFRKAFPDQIPADTDFAAVVNNQPAYSKLRYPVPIIGWKHHPEEFHVTPEGALVLPTPRKPSPLYLTPLLSIGSGQPAMFDPDAVSTSLVDGYKPGIQSVWRRDGLKIEQVAFGSLLEGTEVVTGRETLLGVVRFQIANETAAPIKGALHINLGKAVSGHKHKLVAPDYPAAFSFADSSFSEADGSTAASIVSNSLGRVSFISSGAPKQIQTLNVLNADGVTITKPEYEFEVVRTGDRIQAAGWESEKGFDFYYESSLRHSSSGAIEIELINAAGGRNRLGFLSMTGLAEQMAPVSDFVAPGDHTPAVAWAMLKDIVPQGPSRFSLRPYYPGPSSPARASAWEPLVYLAKPGTIPVFQGPGNAAQNTLQVAFNLAPGKSGTLDLVVPYCPLPAKDAEKLRGVSFDSRLGQFRSFWEQELNRNAQFIVPEPRLRDAYRAWIAYNLLLVDRDPATGFLLVHPDATMYEMVWGGDASVVLNSMDRLGYHKEATDYARYFFHRQGKRKPDGDVDSAEGFFPGDAAGLAWLSENGFILWALCEHYKLTGDTNWLTKHAPQLAASADWLIRQRERTKQLVDGQMPRNWGLMVKGRPSDLGDWDNWYFIDTYSYMGMRWASEVLADAGLESEATNIREAAADYKACILDSLERSINRNVEPPFIPLTPQKNENPTADYLYRYWYSLNPPIYMVEAGLFDARDPKAKWSNYWVEKLGMVTGLCMFMPEVIDAHYVYHQALSYLLADETDKFVWSLYSLYAYGQSRETYATVEWSNLRTGIKEVETWDDCRQPHMHSNSRCLAMLRVALLIEDGEKLHLMKGTPRGWLANGKRIEVRDAPSTFGNVTYIAESKVESGTVSLNIQPPPRKPAQVVLHVRPPSKYGSIRSVTVNGSAWNKFSGDAIELGTLTGPAEVVCKF